MKAWPISQQSQIKYSYYRVRDLINRLKRLIKLSQQNLPENYIDCLYNFINEKHL